VKVSKYIRFNPHPIGTSLHLSQEGIMFFGELIAANLPGGRPARIWQYK